MKSLPNDVRLLFQGTVEDGVEVLLWYVEMGGYLRLSGNHPKFGTSWDDWAEQKERERVAWLVEFLKSSGAPVGSYSWGNIQALYDSRSAQGLATISYT